MSHTFSLNPSLITDFMLKPAVGVMLVISSDASIFSMVVLPALSRPRRSILNSRSGVDVSFLRIDKSP